jgi:hypothetical protein
VYQTTRRDISENYNLQRATLPSDLEEGIMGKHSIKEKENASQNLVQMIFFLFRLYLFFFNLLSPLHILTFRLHLFSSFPHSLSSVGHHFPFVSSLKGWLVP